MRPCSQTGLASVPLAAATLHMLLRLIIICSLTTLAFNLPAQEGGGTVTGLVVSTWDGTPLANVAITVRGTTLAAQTDATGRFELRNVPPGDQVVRFSKSGFTSVTVTDVRVLPGQATTVNGHLLPDYYDLPEYTVTAQVFSDQTGKLIFERLNAQGLGESMGSEQFSRLGVDDAAGALGKLTGATVAEGKFAVIRGLADRYTTATFNGSDVPSADPDRKAAQLDLFPAQFISRIDVNKTFTPDLPGGFAGGAVNIVSRTFPDTWFFTFSVGSSYNTQASLRNDFLFTDQGGLDWAAADDGTRELPSDVERTPIVANGRLPASLEDSFGSRQFAPIEGRSPLNSSMSLAFGGTTNLAGRKFGFLAGVSYKHDLSFYDDGRVTEVNAFAGGRGLQKDKTDTRALIESTWGGVATLSYEPWEDHVIDFNFMYIQTSEDEARRLQGSDENFGAAPPDSYVDQSILHWTERNLQYYQLKGSHLFPQVEDIRLDWAGSLSTTTQDEPDQRIFQFLAQPGTGNFTPNGPSQPARPARIWQELQEDNKSIRADLTIPVPSYNAKENFFKTGAALSVSDRTYQTRGFDLVASGGHPFLNNGDPNTFVSPENLQFIQYVTFPANFQYFGEQTIDAVYAMGDWAAFNWLRLVGGARLERTDISVDTFNATTGVQSPTGTIRQTDLLPALGATFFIRTNLLLRAAWSETVARPTYREISPAFLYDIAQGRTIKGNPNLVMSASENFDLRAEWYPRPGELVSVGVFYKLIDSPIELAAEQQDGSIVFYENYEEAKVYGVEFELRKNLGRLGLPAGNFSGGLNFAYIKSEVPRTPDQLSAQRSNGLSPEADRPLYDQPEYILNADLTWDNSDTAANATTISLSGGVVGRRLVLVGYANPDDYEEPTPQLDFSIQQKFGKHWKAKFSAKNLLDPVYERTQEWPAGTQVIRRYTRGMTFGLSLGCEF